MIKLRLKFKSREVIKSFLIIFKYKRKFQSSIILINHLFNTFSKHYATASIVCVSSVLSLCLLLLTSLFLLENVSTVEDGFLLLNNIVLQIAVHDGFHWGWLLLSCSYRCFGLFTFFKVYLLLGSLLDWLRIQKYWNRSSNRRN
jgi:hypothetical protein